MFLFKHPPISTCHICNPYIHAHIDLHARTELAVLHHKNQIWWPDIEFRKKRSNIKILNMSMVPTFSDWQILPFPVFFSVFYLMNLPNTKIYFSVLFNEFTKSLADLEGRARRTTPKGHNSFVSTYKFFET